jgi:sensor histidine kinase YesM
LIARFLKLSLFLLLITENVSAQYIFDNIRTKDGLSYKQVVHILHDTEGYYWFSTLNGLNRFDGSAIKVFNRANKNVKGLPEEYVNSIVEDTDGNLWLSTFVGVTIFNKWKQTFTPVTFENYSKPLNIIKLFLDNHKKIWAFTYDEGLFWFDKKKQKFVHFTGDSILKNIGIFRLGIEHDSLRNGFWVSTEHGLHFVDYAASKIYNQANNPKQWQVLNNQHMINAVALDNENNLWYSDHTDKAFHHFNFSTKEDKRWGELLKKPYIEFGDGANKLFVDSQGTLWISSWKYRAFYLKKGAKDIEQFDYAIADPNDLGYGYFYDCYEDKKGTVWVGTLNGVSRWRMNHALENIIHIPSYKAYIDVEFAAINDMHLGENGDYWIAKEDGLFYLKNLQAKPERYFISTKELSRNEILTATVVNNEVWCTTYYGLIAFNPATKKFRNIDIPTITPAAESRLHENRIYVTKVFKSQGILPTEETDTQWLHIYKDAFYTYNLKTKQTKRYSIEGEYCRQIFQKKSGEMVVCMGNAIWFFDKKQQKFIKIEAECLKGQACYAVVEDQNGYLWVGTSQGIHQIDTHGKCIYKMTTSEGLTVNSISELEFDQLGNLWIGAHDGVLGYLNIKTKTYAVLDFNTRLPFHEYWANFRQNKKTGQFTISVFDEILVINPQKLQHKEAVQKPIITDIQVFEKEMPFTEKDRLNLTYKQNYFTINFSSPDHRDNVALQYAYKLEDYDDNWIYCGRRLSASYTNVPGGNYRFLVKVIDNQGKQQEKITAFNIYVKPPFWETWWFRLLMFGVFLAIVYWFWQLFRKRQEERKLIEEKERKLLEFNKLLAESKLTALRTQMNPHFVFNCLNSIQECIVFEKYKEAQHYLQKFSRLMRLVLQNSDKNLVPLSQEIEMLNLYLELEKLRFTEKFTYEIIYDEDEIDTESIEIPPMLLQPFVENALWHGLLPKKDNRVLTLSFELLHDDILVCSIDDNGIGRQKSYLLKKNQTSTKKHVSKGIRITQDRLNLISLQYNQHARIEIIDKEDAEGNPTGTKVVIELAVG